MKKLSFIMAVLMILMCMPIMAISAAEEVVAPDANAPEDVKEIHKNLSEAYWLYEYESDEAAIADGAFGRFCKEGGFGYAKTWTAVAAQAKDCGATVFYLITDAEATVLGRTTAFGVGSRELVVDGALGQDKSEYGYTIKVAGGRFLQYDKSSEEVPGKTGVFQSTLGRLGSSLTFRNIYVDATGVTGALMQHDANVAGPALTFDNVYFDAPKAQYGVVARGYDQTLTFNDVYLQCLGNGSNSAVVFADQGAGKITLNVTNSDLKGTNYCLLISRDADVVVKDSNCINDRPARSAASVQCNGGLLNVTIDGGVYGQGLGFLVNSGVKTGSVFNIYDGTFSASGSGVSNAIRCQCNNMVEVNIYGGNWYASEHLIYVTANGGGTFNFYGGNFQGKKEIIRFDAKAMGSAINIYGGNFAGDGQRMIRLSGTEGSCALTIAGGNFVGKNYDKAMDVFTSTPTPSSGLIFIEQKNSAKIVGGTFTAYKDNGITLATEDAFVYCWKASESVNPSVEITGGIFNGGKCFLADVVYSGDKNAPIDEAKSTFYYYTEGTNGVTLEPKATQGASVRLDKNSSGLRFTATIDALAIKFIEENLVKEGTELSYGTMIVPSNYVKYAGGELTMEAFDKAGKAYLNIEAKDGVIVNEDGSVTINAAMVNIKKENYDRDFIAVAYIKYTDKTGAEVIKYATNVTLAAFSRNVQEVAHAALADVLTTSAGTYTNKVDGYYVWNQNARKYEYVTGTAYSRYNAEQLAVLKSYIIAE